MTVASGSDFVPRRSRRWLGPLFGAVCLLATTIGVVVLGVLIFAILAAAMQGEEGEGLWALLGRLVHSLKSIDPEHGRLPRRDRRQPLAARAGLRDGDSGRRRRGGLSSRNTPRRADSAGRSR